MGRSFLILGLQALAGWSSWVWYAQRMRDGSDEPWGLLALLAMGLVLPRGARHPLEQRDLVGLAAVNTALVLTSPWLPPLLRAAGCVLSVTALVSRMTTGRAFHVGTWLLALLSLPVLSSVQFYLGYPLRLLAATLASPLLNLLGVPASREGLSLRIGSQAILVDAPCSGARMLWVGLFLAVTLACLLRLGTRRTLLTCGLAVGAILLGNALRVCALTLVEGGHLAGPSWLHDGVGVTSFIPVCLSIAAICLWQRSCQQTVEARA
ncbi:archaeosortase/exosortase family protein [Stigmatella aurantiaca]|uniref:Conserved uncharacterized protein n=1 Tax=Stigmatella aurantiaca (strain DW4/3-1) TaxID=378806 RepID=Q09A48_STIAD|nr:archaeosortase/exosortase family protein [Stigmatella aurantiaca]ADO68898.1 conserved uncharacterized protein [Stigmatella aurantiaca DW4/3-1]EAU68557.1 hypothetical protein STIAU_8813 [Stigmatella aurantiaca DW4/3-1]